MPSPVAHSLLGLTLGLACALPRTSWRRLFHEVHAARWLLLGAVFLANAPDLDYLPGLLVGDLNAYHHHYTHTIAWVFIVGAGFWLLVRCRRPVGWPLFAFVMAALLSHLVADVVTEDARYPYGVMLLWPFTDTHFAAPYALFPRWRKDSLGDVFQAANLGPVLVEIAWTLPLVMLTLVWKCHSRGAPDPGAQALVRR